MRLDEKTSTALTRLGLRKIGDLATAPRAPLARRFGANVLMRLDQALGQQPEEIMPLADPPHYDGVDAPYGIVMCQGSVV